MGSDASAYIFYGFSFEEEDYEAEEIDYDEWEELYATAIGLHCPLDIFSSETEDQYDSYWKALRAAILAGGCEVNTHGYMDEPTTYVYINDSHVSADWDGPTEFDPRIFNVVDDWNPKLKDFCALLKIPYEEPKWYLAAYWG